MDLEKKVEDSIDPVKKFLNKSFGLGLLAGLLIATSVFSGYLYLDSLDHRTEVPITVITCEECNYEDFKKATDRMFNTNYREVNYKSEEGQELIQKYNLKYVPAFAFDKKVENAKAFERTKSSLVKFEDAYVIPDEGRKVAQRLSEGKSLDN